jgi:uncharacterized circularly permuted ATP-grasp superfamily protein
MSMMQLWRDYDPGEFYDELMYDQHQPRHFSYKLLDYLKSMRKEAFAQRIVDSELEILERGITFTVYSDAGNIDRAWPFDIIPRIIPKGEWDCTEKGLVQRIRALNMFINDIYNDGNIIRDGLIPEEVVLQSKGYRPQCKGMQPAHGIWAHICGSDLVRDDSGTMYVLEDNLRVPSGVAYMLENRKTTYPIRKWFY